MRIAVLRPVWMAVVCVLLAVGATTARAQVTALIGGRIIDGRGGAPIEDGVLLLHGDTIAAVGPRARVIVPKGARVIDVRGMSVLPGLIESNGHVVFDGQIDHAAYFAGHSGDYQTIGAKNLRLALAQGVTTVRDTHGPVRALLQLKQAVASGRLTGARLFTAGAILNYESLLDIPTTRRLDSAGVAAARRELDRFVASADEGVRAVRELHESGVDFIKISLSGGAPSAPPPVALSDEALAAMVREAHRLGLRTTAHAMSRVHLRRALAAGFDAIEHPAFMIEQGKAVELPNDLVQEMARRRVYGVPLLVAMEVYNRYATTPALLRNDSLVGGLQPELVHDAREWARVEHDTPGAVAALDARYATVRTNQRTLIRAGVPLAMGTDKGTRLNYHEHANHVRELEIYTALGMTPLEAITSATLRGAELLGVARQLGTLEAGKWGDVVVVAGNPAVRIGDLRNVRMVFKGGAKVR